MFRGKASPIADVTTQTSCFSSKASQPAKYAPSTRSTSSRSEMTTQSRPAARSRRSSADNAEKVSASETTTSASCSSTGTKRPPSALRTAAVKAVGPSMCTAYRASSPTTTCAPTNSPDNHTGRSAPAFARSPTSSAGQCAGKLSYQYPRDRISAHETGSGAQAHTQTVGA